MSERSESHRYGMSQMGSFCSGWPCACFYYSRPMNRLVRHGNCLMMVLVGFQKVIDHNSPPCTNLPPTPIRYLPYRINHSHWHYNSQPPPCLSQYNLHSHRTLHHSQPLVGIKVPDLPKDIVCPPSLHAPPSPIQLLLVTVFPPIGSNCTPRTTRQRLLGNHCTQSHQSNWLLWRRLNA